MLCVTFGGTGSPAVTKFVPNWLRSSRRDPGMRPAAVQVDPSHKGQTTEHLQCSCPQTHSCPDERHFCSRELLLITRPPPSFLTKVLASTTCSSSTLSVKPTILSTDKCEQETKSSDKGSLLPHQPPNASLLFLPPTCGPVLYGV
jgi:hypothetical protein